MIYYSNISEAILPSVDAFKEYDFA